MFKKNLTLQLWKFIWQKFLENKYSESSVQRIQYSSSYHLLIYNCVLYVCFFSLAISSSIVFFFRLCVYICSIITYHATMFSFVYYSIEQISDLFCFYTQVDTCWSENKLWVHAHKYMHTTIRIGFSVKFALYVRFHPIYCALIGEF